MTTWNRNRLGGRLHRAPQVVFAPRDEEDERAYKRAFRGVIGAMSRRELRRLRRARVNLNKVRRLP